MISNYLHLLGAGGFEPLAQPTPLIGNGRMVYSHLGRTTPVARKPPWLASRYLVSFYIRMANSGSQAIPVDPDNRRTAGQQRIVIGRNPSLTLLQEYYTTYTPIVKSVTQFLLFFWKFCSGKKSVRCFCRHKQR